MATKSFTLVVWRQDDADSRGDYKEYEAKGITDDMSFLEMLDVINEDLVKKGERPIEFDNDCREGICGSCGFCINGQPHGPEVGVTVCQLHMRSFENGQRLVLDPWRARAFPVLKDLVVDRNAFDRIIQAGGYISVKTGPKPDANSIPIGKDVADRAFDAAACIGCGACVAACPNASASLFAGAKITQLALLPQGHPERVSRVRRMNQTMQDEGFGYCSNIGECEAACPKEISLDTIAIMKREYLRALFSSY